MLSFLTYLAQIGVFVFCLLAFVRNLDESLVKKRIKPELMPKIVTVFIILSIFGSLFAEFFVIWMLLILIFGQTIVYFVQIRRNRRVECAVLLMVQHIVLNISAGNSFKQAYFQSLLQFDRSTQTSFKSIWDIQNESNNYFPGPRSHKLSQIVRQCRKNSSSALELIKELRRGMQVEEGFLQKLRIGLAQIRTQLGFIGIFFLGLLFVDLKLGLFQNYSGWMFLALLLFFIGSLLVSYLPRSFRWSN